MKNKNFKICLIILFLVSSCKNKDNVILSNNEMSEIISDDNISKASYDDQFDLDFDNAYNLENIDVIYKTIGKLSSLKSYKKESKDVVTSKVAFINYKQTTNELMIKNADKYYNLIKTSSTFINTTHQAFYYNGKVVYQNNDADIFIDTSSNYDALYGFSPCKLLSGQLFNDNTIKEVTKLDDNTYKIILDKELTNLLLIKRMKTFGSLNDYPVFLEDTIFTIKIDDSYNPLSYTFKTSYEVNMSLLGKIKCSEENETTFSSFNEDLIIDNEDDYLMLLNSKV